MKRQVIKILHDLFPTSLFTLALIEILILVSAFSVGLSIYTETDPNTSFNTIEWLLPLLWAGMIVASMMVIGLYWRDNIREKLERLFRTVLGLAVGFLMICLSLYYLHNGFNLSFDSNVFVIATGVAFSGIFFVRYLFYEMIGQDFMKKRFLVIGAGKKALQLLDPALYEVSFIGFIPFSDSVIELPDSKLLMADVPIVDIAKNYDVDGILVAMDDRRKKFPVEDLIECKMNGIKVMELDEFFEMNRKYLNLSDLNPSSIIFSNGFRHAILKNKSKRLFDISVSLVLFLLALPMMLLASIIIWAESHFQGTIIYRQTRVGKDGKPFEVLKFRTMREDAEKDGEAQWASKNDSRATKTGRVLRKYRIDELPQLINVIRGDMSFVGPRPERPVFVKELAKNIPYYNLRHRIKPGITGWAQICYSYGDSEEDARSKLQYDLYYIKNYSLLLDLHILFQTAHIVLWGRGAR